MKKRTTQLLAELKTLARQAEANLYTRIGYACEVMADLDWIATVHGGSDLKASDALQDEYFRDLGGFISLGKLMAMYRKVEKQRWEEVKFDVAAVEVIYDDSNPDQVEKGKRTSWKKVAEERKAKIEELERQIKTLVEANGQLREEVTELRAKAARLEGRIEEMDRKRGRREMVEA
jgi:hypothetical protein